MKPILHRLTLFVLIPLFASSANALTLVQPNVQPVYELVFTNGTDFNMTGGDLVVPSQAIGSASFEIADSDLANLALTTIPLVSALGNFQGSLPAGLPLPAGTPFDLNAFQFISGELTNVVRGVGGSIDGADVSFTVLFEQIVAPGSPNQVRLFGDPMTFTGPIDSIPFSVGTSFVSPDPVDLYVDLGGGASALVGSVQNRFLNVVPEPSAAVLLLLGAAGAAYGVRRRG